MTLTNGDSSNAHSQLMLKEKILDHTKALEILDNEYFNADGIDAKTLLDSKINGGLTYNDFLVLPGYISMVPLPDLHNHSLTSDSRFCCFRGRFRHPSHQENYPQNTFRLLSYGHSYRALDGNSHGLTRWTRSYTSQLFCRGPSRDGPKSQAIRERLHSGPCCAFAQDHRRRSEGTKGEMGIRRFSSHRSVSTFELYLLPCLPFCDYQSNTNNFRSSKTILSYCGDTFFNPMRKRQPTSVTPDEKDLKKLTLNRKRLSQLATYRHDNDPRYPVPPCPLRPCHDCHVHRPRHCPLRHNAH